MQYFGFFLLFLGVVALIVGALQQSKAKKILSAPFKKTGEVAQNPQVADAKGTISCEGAIQVQQPLIAPCSGRPCIYYEIKITRHVEKQVRTENGFKTNKTDENVSTSKTGSVFAVNDGSGAVGVDSREGIECDMEKTFDQRQNVAWGDVVFGQYRAHVPARLGDGHTSGITCIETIVPPDGNLFVLGKLVAGTVKKTDGMLGKLVASRKGREKLLGSTKRNAMIGFVLGGLCLVSGIPMSIFGHAPKDPCAGMTDQIAQMCTGHITNDEGVTYDWTVTKAGNYEVKVLQPSVLEPIIPVLTIKDEAGHAVTDEHGDVSSTFKPGKYKINVHDIQKGEPGKLQGGFSFSLNILSGGSGASTTVPVAAASGEPAAVVPAKGAAPHPAAVVPAKKK